ncbi:MAG: MFS transporter [Candidatus Odinarchaeota archaeon]
MTIETGHKEFNPRKNLFSLCLASFIIITGYSVIVPFLPIYANDILTEITLPGFIVIGIGLQIGIIMSGNLLMKLFLSPAYGDLSDVTGRKPIIVIGMAAYTLLMVGYGFANDFFALLILRMLSGVAGAAVWPVGQALVVDTSDEKKQGTNLGLYMLSMMAGLTTGPFIGYGFFTLLSSVGFSELDAYRYTFVCVALFGLLATFCVIFLVTDPVTLKSKISAKKQYISAINALLVRTVKSPVFLVRTVTASANYRTRTIYTIYLVAIINGFASALLIPLVAMFLEDFYLLGPDSIALVIGIVGILAFPGAPIGGKLSDKIGRKRVVVAAGIAGGIIIPFLGFKTNVLVIVLIFAAIRFFSTVAEPSFRAFQSDLVPEEVRGKEFGIVDASFNFGSVLGPIVGGYLYDIFFDVTFNFGNLVFIGSAISFALSGVLVIISNFLLLIFTTQKSLTSEDHTVETIPN